jgi:hypothetical protein
MAESLPEQDVEKQPRSSMEVSTPAAAGDLDTKDNAQADPNIVTWDGPDDPANPMNWTTKKKVTAVGIVSFITFLSYVATLESIFFDFADCRQTPRLDYHFARNARSHAPLWFDQ